MKWLIGFSLCLALVGCKPENGPGEGQSEQPVGPVADSQPAILAPTMSGTEQGDLSPTTSGVMIDPQQTNTPQKAVEVFLVALLSADQETSDAMLTDKAREENERHQQTISPPGSKTASFVIGEMEYITETPDEDPPLGAHVLCTLTDVYEGETESHDIVWILRNEENGWRIAGMAMQLFEDMEPLILNFEDPVDVARQTEQAEAEMARRADQQLREAETLQATQSAGTGEDAPR